MTNKEIVKKHLKDNGFDGLFNEDLCGCSIEDLMACDEPLPSCQSGYKVMQSDGNDFDYIIQEEKP